MIEYKIQDLEFYKWNIFEQFSSNFFAAVTTRHGGFSRPPFESLNLGHHVGDSSENVIKNKHKITEALYTLNIPADGWIYADQIHGTKIAEAEKPVYNPVNNTDGFYSSKKGIICTVLLADCLPVIIYDSNRHTAVICHAGWRGTNSGIAGKAVKKMLRNGSRIENMYAAAGPGIGSCCFTVGRDTADAFINNKSIRYPEGTVTNRKGLWSIDLETANAAWLEKYGIPAENIEKSDLCTSCGQGSHETEGNIRKFFSYRKENGKTGRQAAFFILY
jgi:YfiH family protein